MAFEDDDILNGLDLSVLDGIASGPEGDATKENGEGDDPGILNPGLNIQEVDELPGDKGGEQDEDPDKDKTPPAAKDADEDGEDDSKDGDEEDDPASKVPEGSEAGEGAEEDDEEVNAFRVFAEMQRDQGLIDFKDDEFEESDDWMLEQVQKSIDSKVTEYKESLPEEIKYLLDNYEEGVSIYDLMQANASQRTYESINPESLEDSVSTQKKLVRDLLTASGLSEAQINKKITRYEDAGVLLEEAEEALGSLKHMEGVQKENMIKHQKEEQKRKVAAHEKWLVDLKDHISKKEEIIPGFSMTPKEKDSLYKGITKLDRHGKNEIMRAREADPEFDLKIAYLATVLKWDFSAFERQSTTKATKKLSDAIKSTKKAGSRPSRGSSKNVDFDTMRKSLRGS